MWHNLQIILNWGEFYIFYKILKHVLPWIYQGNNRDPLRLLWKVKCDFLREGLPFLAHSWAALGTQFRPFCQLKLWTKDWFLKM